MNGMKRKKKAGMVCSLLCINMLMGCGALTDFTNYNFPKENVAIIDENDNQILTEEFSNKNKTVEIYYDVSSDMQEVVQDPIAQGIVQDSADTVAKLWNDATLSLYTVSNSDIVEQSDAFVSLNKINAMPYAGNSSDIVSQALDYHPIIRGEKVIEPRLKLIITSLDGQLQSYQTLGQKLSKDIMQNHRSFAILSVDTKKPMFIFAIGLVRDLEEYITEFYQMPNVQEYNGVMNWNTADFERKINCKLYLQNCGIYGINYNNINPIARGDYRYDTPVNGNVQGSMPPPPPDGNVSGSMPPSPPDGNFLGSTPPPPPDGNFSGSMPPPGGGAPRTDSDSTPPGSRKELLGSFETFRPDYTADTYKTYVEGSVNFGTVQDEIEIEVPEDVSEEDIQPENIKNFTFRSLLYEDYFNADKGASDEEIARKEEEKRKVAGKIKMTVPFDSVSLIQLTDLTFSIQTKYFDANESDNTFYDSDSQVTKNIEVAFANNEGPTTSAWRLDNVDRTAMFNIYVASLVDLPYATKLDLYLSAYDPGKVPLWVDTWSKRPGYENLKSLITLLNSYNEENGRYEERLTVYVMASENDEVQLQPISMVKPLLAQINNAYLVKSMAENSGAAEQSAINNLDKKIKTAEKTALNAKATEDEISQAANQLEEEIRTFQVKDKKEGK